MIGLKKASLVHVGGRRDQLIELMSELNIDASGSLRRDLERPQRGRKKGNGYHALKHRVRA